MPQVGHGMLGLGLAAATASQPTSRRLREGWFGALVLACYVPDFAEWAAKVAGAKLPHSCLASVPMLGVWLALTGLFLWMMRERSPLAIATLLFAVASHTIMDAMSGGIPIWWPLSYQVVGNRWLDVFDWPIFRLLLKESIVFAPLATAGIAIAVSRRGGVWSIGGIWLMFVLSVIAAYYVSLPAMAAIAIAMSVMGLLVWRAPFWRGLGWQVAFASPMLLMFVAHLTAWVALQTGDQHFEKRDYLAARGWYQMLVTLRCIGLDGVGEYHVGECHRLLGEDRLAYEMYQQSLREAPYSPDTLRGLVELHLGASDGQIRNAQQAASLAQVLPARGRSPAEVRNLTRYRDDVLKRAAEAMSVQKQATSTEGDGE